MIIVESFIKKDKQSIISDIDNIDKNLFVNIENHKILDIKNLDYDYLEGAIILSYNNQEYLGFENWDLIEQLWGYFIIAIKELRQEKKVEFQFPDTPFTIGIEKKNNACLEVLFHDKKMNIDLFEFVSNVLNAAMSFYKNLKQLFIHYKYEIDEQIENIQNVKDIWSVK